MTAVTGICLMLALVGVMGIHCALPRTSVKLKGASLYEAMYVQSMKYRGKSEPRGSMEERLARERACGSPTCKIPGCEDENKYGGGWHIRGNHWGCCGNYKECCDYASAFCYHHDKDCECCEHWHCTPWCVKEDYCD